MIAINATQERGAGFRAAALLLLIFFAFLAVNPALTGDSVRRGLNICATAVIPSLFPFMVLSSLMASGGAAPVLGGALARPVSALFGLSGACAPAILLGALSGFPVGARCALSLYRAALCSKDEAERLLAFCNNAGPSFVIAGIGISVFGDFRLGAILYASELCSAFAVAQLMRPHRREKTKTEGSGRKAAAAAAFSPALLVSAVTESAAALINVCAFVVFFAVVCDSLALLCTALKLPAIIPAALSAILEVTSGERAAAAFGVRGFILGGAALGWSGISVHLQVLSILQGSGLSCRRYFIGKTMQAAICALLCAAYAFFSR